MNEKSYIGFIDFRFPSLPFFLFLRNINLQFMTSLVLFQLTSLILKRPGSRTASANKAQLDKEIYVLVHGTLWLSNIMLCCALSLAYVIVGFSYYEFYAGVLPGHDMSSCCV